jgi:hypothetical protein
LNPDASAVLNLSEDHLDRYAGMRDYADAKQRIFLGDGIQVVNRQDEWARGMAGSGRKVFTFGLDAPWEDGNWGLRDIDGELWLAEGRANLMKVSELKVKACTTPRMRSPHWLYAVRSVFHMSRCSTRSTRLKVCRIACRKSPKSKASRSMTIPRAPMSAPHSPRSWG